MSGQQLEKEIKKLGLTHTKFCQVAGFSTRTLSKMRNNEVVREETWRRAQIALKTLREELGTDVRFRLGKLQKNPTN